VGHADKLYSTTGLLRRRDPRNVISGGGPFIYTHSTVTVFLRAQLAPAGWILLYTSSSIHGGEKHVSMPWLARPHLFATSRWSHPMDETIKRTSISRHKDIAMDAYLFHGLKVTLTAESSEGDVDAS
jgi:hypothetical protein